MKALSSIPLQSKLDKILHYLHQDEPVLTLEPVIYMGPVEIKRFIHNLRQNRRYTTTKDFIY